MDEKLKGRLHELFSDEELEDLCRFKELDKKITTKGEGLSKKEYTEYEVIEEMIKGTIFKSL
jgi:hypothetical protein